MRATNKQLKCVRANNGGEYNGPFEEYCKSHGIRLEKSIPKTSHENGVAERMNRSITERIKCMLSNAKLPKSFWGTAMKTAVDLINLSPSIPLKGDIPERVWRNKDLSFKHLKVFGCRAFVHIPEDERAKLDAKSKEYMYLFGAMKIKNLVTNFEIPKKKVIRSRDVIFIEDQTIEDINKNNKAKSPFEIPTSSYSDSSTPDHVDHEEVQTEQGENTGDDPDTDVHDPVIPPANEPRRSTKLRRQSTRYNPNDYLLLTNGEETESYDEALEHEKKKEWWKAMEDEMKPLHENHTYDLMELPQAKRALKNK